MLAVLLGPWLLDTFAHGPRRGPDVWAHVEETFRPLALRMNVPRKTSWELREILGMQAKLARPDDAPRKLATIVHRPVFPEALVYFELELRARDQDLAPVDRWREIADDVWRSSHRPRHRTTAADDHAGPPSEAALRDGGPFSDGEPADLAAEGFDVRRTGTSITARTLRATTPDDGSRRPTPPTDWDPTDDVADAAAAVEGDEASPPATPRTARNASRPPGSTPSRTAPRSSVPIPRLRRPACRRSRHGRQWRRR